MKVLVCGSRDWGNSLAIDSVISSMPKGTVVITGGARGADRWAHEAAQEAGLATMVFKADWTQYGRAAGYRRNIEMLDEQPDLVVAFWDGLSRGTAHTIREARKRGIQVSVIEP